MNILIVGFGNTLRGDDGVGPLVVAGLAAEPRLGGTELRVQHQLAPELATDIASAHLLVLVDAADDGRAPGTVRIRRLQPAEPRRSWHHVDPETVLGLADALYGSVPPSFLVTITGADFGVGERLSAPVQRALPRARASVVALTSVVVPNRQPAIRPGDVPDPPAPGPNP